MIIKSKNNWDFTVFQNGEDEIISVVFFNSMVDFTRSFMVNEDEKLLDFEGLKRLSENIRNNYELFAEREIIPAITNLSDYTDNRND